MFLLVIFLASFGFLSAQDFVLQNQDVNSGQVIKDPDTRPMTRADLQLGYATGIHAADYGYSTASTYLSGCISFTEAQVLNYVGGSLHTIEVYVPMAGSMANLTSYRVWIKTAIDGPVVYEETVTPSAGSGFKFFELETPYTITAAPLVIGYTAGFSVTTGGRYPFSVETVNAPYPAGAYNVMQSTNINGHGAGANAWGMSNERALLIFGHVTGDPLPTNDLAVSGVSSTSLKWVNGEAAFTVNVYNAGTAPQDNYTVQLLDAANTVLATQAVNTTIAAGTFANVNVYYAPTTAGTVTVKGKVILGSDENPANDVSAPLTQRVFEQQPMSYAGNTDLNGVGTNGANTFRGAIDFPAANMGIFAGKTLTTIEVGLSVPPSMLSNCSVWIRNTLTGTEIVSKAFTPVEGWNVVELDDPYTLPFTGAVVIGYTVTTTGGYPMGTTANPQNAANGGHLQIGTGAWQTLAVNSLAGNNAIIGVVEMGDATPVTITTNVSPAGTGTVTGDGVYAAGATVTLRAIPNPGYTFLKWDNNATDNPLVFTTTADATYTAIFEEKTCAEPVVGAGTTAVGFPIQGYFYYTYTQALFTAADLGGVPGQQTTINALSFQYNNAAAVTRANVNIYLANTNKTNFDGTTSANFVPISDMQLVWSGNLPMSQGWVDIEFNNLFKYTGGGLVVAIQTGNGSGYYGASTDTRHLAHATTNYTTLSYWGDPIININNPTFTATNMVRYQSRNNFKFEICPIPPICDDYEIAPGTPTPSYGAVPINCWYGNNYTQIIYDADEIGDFTGNASIKSLSLESLRAITRNNVSVFLGNTSKSEFASTSDWVDYTTLQEVYSGPLNLIVGSLEIEFETPFTYTGGNLVVVFLNRQANSGDGTTNTFNIHNTTGFKFLNYYWDGTGTFNIASPPAASGTYGRLASRPNINFHVCGFPALVDMQAMSITGPVMTSEGNTLDYTVTVKNGGEVPAKNFTVQILNAANVVLASQLVTTPLAVGETTTVTLPVTFNAMGTWELKGRVEIARDMVPDNNETGLLSVQIFHKCLDPTMSPIGNPATTTTTYNLPFAFWHNSGISQSIYLASEIDLDPGTSISGVKYSYSGSTAAVEGKLIRLYITHTTLNNFATTTSYILPLSASTLVYEGNANIPAGSYEFEITFNTPFIYNGGNLCITAERPRVGTVSDYVMSSYAQVTTVTPTNRVIYYNNDSNPFNPGTPQTGTLASTIPNIQIVALSTKQFGLNPENIAPAGITISLVPETGVPCGGNGTVYFDAECSIITNVIIDGVSMGPITSFEFVNQENPLPVIVVEAVVDQFTVTASVIGIGGTIDPVVASTCGGEAFTFNITPDDKYAVDAIYYNGVNQYVSSMTKEWTSPPLYADATLQVSFKLAPHKIYVEYLGLGDGFVEFVEYQGTSNQISTPVKEPFVAVEDGSSPLFLFVPAYGSYLEAVYVDGAFNQLATNMEFHRFIAVNADHELKVEFGLNNMYILATAGLNGAISPAGNIPVPYGTTQRFNFIPNTGYVVDEVFVNNVVVATGPGVTYYDFKDVVENGTIHVTFTKEIFIIYTPNCQGMIGGTMFPCEPVGVNVAYNGTQRFEFTPATGYKISQVWVDNVPYPPAVQTGSYTFYYVTETHSIRVEFEPLTYPITASINGNGMITDVGTTQVEHGTNKAYQFRANIGYEITNLFIDGVNTAFTVNANGLGSYTFVNVTAPHTISVITRLQQFTLSASVLGTGGIITPSGNFTVGYGDNKAFTFTPAPGHEIDEVRIDGIVNAAAALNGTHVFMNITQNHSIEVSFKLMRFQIASTAGGNGSIYPEGILDVNYGEEVTYEFYPEEGYEVLDVLVNNVSVGAVNTYTFTEIDANGSINVTFTPILGIVNPTMDGISIYSQQNIVHITNLNLLPIQDVSIMDMYGRLVWQGNVYGTHNPITLEVANGIYAVRVATNDQFTTAKVSIQR